MHAPREHYLASSLLLDSLEHAAATDPRAHLMLAALHRCSKPNPYLYEESLKGRQLSASERGWVEDYLRLAPRHQRYEMHLKAAAEAGVRAAALECGTMFERPEFIALAERLDGEVDPEQMARVTTSLEARARWLRQAAEAGSRTALENLADLGDPWAEDQMAPIASMHWLRATAERALGEGDPVRAWVSLMSDVWALAGDHSSTQPAPTRRVLWGHAMSPHRLPNVARKGCHRPHVRRPKTNHCEPVAANSLQPTTDCRANSFSKKSTMSCFERGPTT